MKKIDNILRFSAITNFLLSLFKVVVGFLGKSAALIADGIHSFSDLLTDFFAIFGNHIASKPADLKHPYGHGKLEYMTSCGIGLVIVIIGLSLIGNSLNRNLCIPSKIVIVASIITILSKFVLSTYLIRKGNFYKNNILISSGKESRADVYSSIVVLLSSILIQFSNSVGIFKYSDIVATIIVGIFIVKTGFLILKDNLSILIGEQEIDDDYYKLFKDFVLKDKDIYSIDDLVMLKYGPYFKITMEVSMDGSLSLEKAHSMVHKLEDRIMNKFEWAKYITIHINPAKNVSNNE